MIDIITKLDQEIAKKIKTYPHPNNRASEAGHPCKRFLIASRIMPEKKALHDLRLQRIFDEGNLHEQAVLREIENAGFRIVEQQRPYEWQKFQLSGRIDAKISVNDNSIPLEIKSCSHNIFETIKKTSPEEMVNSKYFWIRRYPAQLMLYSLMEGIDLGIMIFKNKTTGEKHQKEVAVDYAYVEGILKKLEEVNSYVQKRELPPVEICDECQGCPFAKTLCFPDMDYGPGFELLSDSEIEAKLIRREELKDPAKEFKELDDELKEYFKGKSAIIGEFKIESKEFERKPYEVKGGKYWRTTIEKLGG